MRTQLVVLTTALATLMGLGCEASQGAAPAGSGSAKSAASQAQADNLPPLEANNIVSIAVGSKDHTTLVTALKAADYVTSVANPGPFTVFAPTNAAFDKLPKGTVEGLLKPEKKEDLANILKYHVTTSVYPAERLKDGDTLSMANGAKAKITVKDGKISINDANVVTSIRGSNGVVHVIDAVLLPPKKD